MKAHPVWLWVVTAANAAVLGLLILAIYGILLALSVLAPYIYTWPLFALLTAGIILSVVGLRSSAGAEPRVTRRVGFLVNGAALTVDVVVALGIATVLIRSTREQIMIPDGYQGDVYIIHSAADGEASRTRGGITYRIPRDGILRVKEPLSRN
jgi:hypothetical protein